jgi:hypothetical protein
MFVFLVASGRPCLHRVIQSLINPAMQSANWMQREELVLLPNKQVKIPGMTIRMRGHALDQKIQIFANFDITDRIEQRNRQSRLIMSLNTCMYIIMSLNTCMYI